MGLIFSLEAKVTNPVLNLSFNVMKDNQFNEYAIKLRGCTVFRAKSLKGAKNGVKNYHLLDICGTCVE